MSPADELAALLRPAGGGIHAVSTGRAERLGLQKRLYAAADEAEIAAKHRAAVAAVASTKVAILAIPSDAGAGLVRGAAQGPQGIREALLVSIPDFTERARRSLIVDVGDVFCVPQLLHDDMLSDAQRAATRAAIYASWPAADAAALPVSPLSMAERALEALLTVNPSLRFFVLGGDHSVAWPVVSVMARRVKEPWAILQIDAHTDLLPERLGVRYNFATWAYHANEALGRSGRLIQVGIRASSKTRAHWESTLGVRQIWADEVAARGEQVIDDVVAHLRGTGAKAVYLSNDIDGTDGEAAPATGAPEPAGLSPDFVRALIRRVGAEIPLLGGDVVEVAPPVGDAAGSRRTCEIAASYLVETLRAMVPGFAVWVLLLAMVSALACSRGRTQEASPAPAATAAPRPSPSAPPSASLGRGALLFGSVRRLCGGPALPVVSVLSLQSRRPVHTFSPGADGGFRLEMAPGRYRFAVRGHECPGETQEIDVIDRQAVSLLVRPGIVPPTEKPSFSAPQGMDAPRGEPSLEVALEGIDGKPAAGAWAWVWIELKGSPFHAEARADDAGVVRFYDLPAGPIRFGADHPSGGILDGRDITRAATGLTRARYGLQSGGSLQGRVVTKDGQPITNVPVALTGAPLVVPAGPFFDPTRVQVTDETGAFRFHGLRRGRFRVEAAWQTELPRARYSWPKRLHPPLGGIGTPVRPPPLKRPADDIVEISVSPGEHMGGLSFVEPPPTGVISGTIEEAGNPKAGAVVEVFFAAAAGRSKPAAARLGAVMSDGEGRFTVPGLFQGRRYRLESTGAVAEIDLAEGSCQARLVVK